MILNEQGKKMYRKDTKLGRVAKEDRNKTQNNFIEIDLEGGKLQNEI